MKLLNGKIFLGTTLAIALGAFAVPAGAAVPLKANSDVMSNVGVQYAQADVDEVAHEKAHEIKSGTVGAANAVRAAHRRHERNEYRHHTVGSKIDSKINEVDSEAKGAGRAVERAHNEHEAVERSQGRD